MTNHDHLKKTIETMYGQKTLSSGIFRRKQGMQFGRPGAQYVWFLLMLVFTMSIVAMINFNLIAGLLILLLTPFLAAYIIDVRGFEIDFKKGKIRKYTSFLGLRNGEWVDLTPFSAVRVYLNELKTERGKFTRFGPKKYDTHSYYYVKLVSEGLNISIPLLELKNYDRAKFQAEQISRHARLRFIEKPAKTKVVKA